MQPIMERPNLILKYKFVGFLILCYNVYDFIKKNCSEHVLYSIRRDNGSSDVRNLAELTEIVSLNKTCPSYCAV